MSSVSSDSTVASGKPPTSDQVGVLRPSFAAALALLTGLALTRIRSEFEMTVLARGAAWVTANLTGSPVTPTPAGFLIPGAGVPVLVTTACSAGNFFVMLATLVTWHLARRGRPAWQSTAGGVVLATLLALLINACRIVTVAQAHRWIIPQFPGAYAHWLHLVTGLAVFLPALIAINVVFERHDPHRPTSRRR